LPGCEHLLGSEYPYWGSCFRRDFTFGLSVKPSKHESATRTPIIRGGAGLFARWLRNYGPLVFLFVVLSAFSFFFLGEKGEFPLSVYGSDTGPPCARFSFFPCGGVLRRKSGVQGECPTSKPRRRRV